jgi:uncharacterized protein (DUF1499 family)
MVIRTLAACGSSRGCVSTQASALDPLRRIEPLPIAADAAQVIAAVLRVISRWPGARVLERDDRYVHAVARSRVLRVPLELELVVDTEQGRLELRASTPFALRERSQARTRALAFLDAVAVELRRVV